MTCDNLPFINFIPKKSVLSLIIKYSANTVLANIIDINNDKKAIFILLSCVNFFNCLNDFPPI